MKSVGELTTDTSPRVPRILIVTEDTDLAAQLDALFRISGFNTTVLGNRDAAVGFARDVDLVLLDLRLLQGKGLDLCADLAREAALVVISGPVHEHDRVAALDIGADDYVTKPFGRHELVARCRAVLRRCTEPAAEGIVIVGDLEIDIGRYAVSRRGLPLPLTTKELALLVALSRRRGALVRRETLAREVWGTELWAVSRSIDVHVSSLRRKIGDSPQRPQYIQTVHGLGFRLRSASS